MQLKRCFGSHSIFYFLLLLFFCLLACMPVCVCESGSNFFSSYFRGVKSISRLWQINKIQTIFLAAAVAGYWCCCCCCPWSVGIFSFFFLLCHSVRFVWFSHTHTSDSVINAVIDRWERWQTVIRCVFIGCTLGELEHVKFNIDAMWKLKMENNDGESFTLFFLSKKMRARHVIQKTGFQSINSLL